MSFVLICWVLAMLSALLWSRRKTTVITLITICLFILVGDSPWKSVTGWIQLIVIGFAPVLLMAQQMRKKETLKQFQAQELEEKIQLKEVTRSLASLQSSTYQFEDEIGEITDAYHVIKETTRSLHLSELFASLLDIAPRLLRAKGLRLIDNSGKLPNVFRASYSASGRLSINSNADELPVSSQQLLELEEVIIKHVTKTSKASSTERETLSCALPEGLSHVAWAPLRREQELRGVLIADELPLQQLKSLSMIADQLALQLARIHLYQQVESLAVTDSLTGLFVRRHFLERAKEELKRSKRHGLSCTLLMVDLDHFKKKNDTYGHLVGDVVLKDIAQLILRNLREVDLMARYGGEEFILLLIETNAEQAMPVATRLAQLVEVHPVRAYDELLTQTISIGVAGYPEDAQTLDELIDCADQALYAAKRAGRNQVIHFNSKK